MQKKAFRDPDELSFDIAQNRERFKYAFYTNCHLFPRIYSSLEELSRT